MFTTGFKYFFGLSVVLVTAAVVYGYDTGGAHVGPVSWGWKGGVGDHFGYVILMGLGFTVGAIGLVVVAYRDADPAAQAHYADVDYIAPTTPVTGSVWPVVGAFGVGIMAVGLVLHSAVFVTGLVVCSLVVIEWAMDAWADRATGDAQANQALRDRIMAPFEIPIAGTLGVGVLVLATSRILLNSSVNGAVVWAGCLATAIFGIGILYATAPKFNKNIISALVLAGGIAVIAGGIVAAVDGEREFHPHEVHPDDGQAEDHSSE